MTNTEAIKKLERQKSLLCHGCVHPSMLGWCEKHCQLPEAFDMAINALKAQEKAQELSNNSPELDKENGELISRAAAIDAIFSEPLYESGMKKRDSDIIVPAIYEKIKALPPSPSRQTEQQIHCNKCKHYQGVHGVQGHAPCSYWKSGGVLWNWYCSQAEPYRP